MMFSALLLAVLVNGEVWRDTSGERINAHGGALLQVDEKYYWYGEHKVKGKIGNSAQVGVHCYSSEDLCNWQDEGIAFAVSEDPESPVTRGCVIERPKVAKAEDGSGYVMYFHLELKGRGYKAAETVIAKSKSPKGPFEFVWHGRPLGAMSRDMTLFTDEDGKVYHIFASEENETLHILKLRPDGLGYTGEAARMAIGDSTEAPAVIKEDGWYYLIGSACTGWCPNGARSYRAKNIFGPWERLNNPCRGYRPATPADNWFLRKEWVRKECDTSKGIGPDLTWGGQSTAFFRFRGRVYAMFDWWRPDDGDPGDGRYVWLPVEFKSDHTFTITWQEAFNGKRERREFANGFAERWHFEGEGELTIDNLEREFEFGKDLKCWPVSHAQGEYKPYTLSTIAKMMPMPGAAKVIGGELYNYATVIDGSAEGPLTIEGDDEVCVIGEAGNLDFARVRFMSGSRLGTVKTVLEGAAKVELPYTTPWLYLHREKNAAKLAERQEEFLDRLLGPAKPKLKWIKPGKVLRVAKLDEATGKAAVDFAKRNSLQYIELDAGWYGQEHSGNPLEPKDFVKPIIEYAKANEIGVILYVNREPLKRNGEDGLIEILDTLKSWGVKGVKYGFVNVGSQKWRKWTIKAIQAAWERELMVDIHDEFRLTGIERYFPNVMTVEGICGNEEMPTPSHNAALPFTRFLDGSGDYTPCWRHARLQTSPCHQLALPLIYPSGFQFLFWYARPDQIDETDSLLDFWRSLPVEFEEVKFLEGKIGEYAIVAKRKGDKWYLGGINANKERTFKLDLSFAGSGNHDIRLFTDDHGDYALNTNAVELTLSANGGFAAIIDPKRYLADRLCMYWQTHATEVYVRSKAVDSAYVETTGGKRAVVPTVMMAGNRSHVTQMKRLKLEDLKPRNEGVFLPWRDSGRQIESVNRMIMKSALNCVAVDPEMAYNVLDTYLLGILYREVATDLDGRVGHLFGMQSMETIHDDIIEETTALYAALKPYLDVTHPEKRKVYDAALIKWAEVQIKNGVEYNNWDIIQLNYILDIASVLPDEDKQHYLDVVLNQDFPRNLSVKSLAKLGFNPKTGIWHECAGYSVLTIVEFLQLADRLEKEFGVNLHAELPVIEKACQSAGEYLFPDGMTIGFGDTHPAPLPKAITDRAAPKSSKFFYAPNASWLVVRSGMDPERDVAFALNASKGNHQHANGISLEMFACGLRFAPDAGIGWKLYSGEDYHTYYSRYRAHNTVIVNGVSDYPPMLCDHAFELVDHGENWAKVTFTDPKTGAKQERTVSCEKRENGGRFKDVFRSKVDNGEREFHEYYLHLLGDRIELEAEKCEATVYWECMKVVTKVSWNSAEGRTAHTEMMPATEGLSRVKEPNYDITEKSFTPCLIIRQEDQMWDVPLEVKCDIIHL